MKSILLLGGTRYFGRGILKTFASRGDNVTVLSRGNRPLPSGFLTQEWIRCDRKDESALREAVSGREFDIVIDNICYDVADAESALRIFSGVCGLYIMTSSIMSYLNLYLQGRALRETDWKYAESTAGMEMQYHSELLKYAKSKRACESLFLASNTLDSVVLRLPNVVGENDFSGRSAVLPQALKRSGAIEFSGHPHDTFQQVYEQDLEKTYLFVADANINELPRSYNVGPPPILVSHYIEMIAEAIGVNAEVSYVNPQISSTNGEPFPKNVSMDCRAIERDLGIAFTPYARFIPKLANWFTK